MHSDIRQAIGVRGHGDAFDDELVDCDGRDPDAVVEHAFDHQRELDDHDRICNWLTLGNL